MSDDDSVLAYDPGGNAMKTMMRVFVLCLSIVLVLSGCGPSQADVNAIATRVASSIFVTQTIATPTPTRPAPTFSLEADGSGDYPTLEEAVRNAPAGATIVLGPGSYRLERRLNILKPIRLVGSGMDQTEIVSAAEGYVIHFSGDGPFVVEDITFRHEGEAVADVVTVMGGEVTFTRCRFTGAARVEGEGVDRAGLWLYGDTVGVVQDCIAEQNNNTGIYVSGQAQPKLEGNRCVNNTTVGIVYWGSAGGTASRNDCSGNSGGITVGKESQPTLEDNNCSDNQVLGIAYTDKSGGIASRNECSRNEVGILVIGKAQPTLQDNICTENKVAGIAFGEDARGTARRNECRRNKVGIFATERAQPTLQNNICNENEQDGILYIDQAGGLVSANECVGNGGAGIAVSITANPSLTGNDCHDNAGGDIEYLKP